MSGRKGQRRWRVPRWLLWAYALLATPFLLSGCWNMLLDVFGREQRNLLITSETRLLGVQVTYVGEPLPTRPENGTWGNRYHVFFGGLRGGVAEPLLEVSWTTEHGTRSVSRIMQPVDSSPVCLFVLRIGADGEVWPHMPADRHYAPFYVDCDYR